MRDGLGPYVKGNVTESGWTVLGWDGGYVAFDEFTTESKSGSTTVIETEHSRDGLTWFAGPSFNPPAADREIAGEGYLGVVQGPGGLLVYDEADCVCECVDPSLAPLAVSRDGVTWQTVKGNIVGNWVDGGPSGFIVAQGSEVATSQDGISWTKTKLRGTAAVKVDRIDSGASFSGGFAVWSETYAGMTRGGMCGPMSIFVKPALWFSADGRTWAQEKLPDSFGRDAATAADVCHIGGRLLFAEEWDDQGSSRGWTSIDGVTWTSVSSDFYCGAAAMPIADHYLYDSFDPYGNWTLQVLGPDLHFGALAATGDLPSLGAWWTASGGFDVLGPAGLIVSQGQGDLWIGVPVAG
jgi:hypothetical protein